MGTINTIKLTPAGMQTPEGVARVTRAVEQQRDALARCANALSDFVADRDADTIQNAWTINCAEIRAAMRQRRKADDELLRAIAGAPEAPQ